MLTDVLSAFTTGSYTVTRTATGTVSSAGIYQAATSTTFSIDASVLPLSGRDLKDLVEGQRADDFRTVYTTSELRTRTSNNDPDVIMIEGQKYRVNTVKHRNILDDYYRAVVEKTDVP